MASVLKKALKMNFFVVKWKRVVSVLNFIFSIKIMWRVT